MIGRQRRSDSEKLNALDEECISSLLAIQQSLVDDTEVRVVLLAGAGRSFCAGADLNYSHRGLVTRQAFRAHNREPLGDQHMRRGLIPGGGSTQRIPRRMGKAHAMDLLLAGRWPTADEACCMGLISRVSDDDRLTADAEALASSLAQTDPYALRAVMRLTNLAYTTPPSDGLSREMEAAVEWDGTPAFQSAMESFTKRERS